MNIDINTNSSETRDPQSYIVIDVESAVTDRAGHDRYLAMERWTPDDGAPGRRGYRPSDDPLKTPRWPFQSITSASAMVLTEHEDGNIQIIRFVTIGQPDHDERGVIAGLLQVLADAPNNAALVGWATSWHDISLILMAAMRYGLSLPNGWKWLSYGGLHRERHIDLARTFTANLKIKPVHMAEVAAALDIPAKLTVPAFSVARLIKAKAWAFVDEVVEGDVITVALLLARWRTLYDGRANADVVEERLLRQIEGLRPGRGYIPALREHRRSKLLAIAANDPAPSTPSWMEGYAA